MLSKVKVHYKSNCTVQEMLIRDGLQSHSYTEWRNSPYKTLALDCVGKLTVLINLLTEV